jgi:hypothetical protein
MVKAGLKVKQVYRGSTIDFLRCGAQIYKCLEKSTGCPVGCFNILTKENEMDAPAGSKGFTCEWRLE